MPFKVLIHIAKGLYSCLLCTASLYGPGSGAEGGAGQLWTEDGIEASLAWGPPSRGLVTHLALRDRVADQQVRNPRGRRVPGSSIEVRVEKKKITGVTSKKASQCRWHSCWP